MSEILWDLRTDRVISEIKAGKRVDGRKVDELRPIEIRTNLSVNADGSAQVRLGKTDVIAGVKFELGEPYPDSPDEGSISVGAELLALASPEFESGPPRDNSIELSRVVDRGIRESKALDFKSLCVTEGEKVWIGFIDIYILNQDGNLFDACSLASVKALLEARIPKLEDGVMVRGEYSGKVHLSKKPVMTTIHKVASTLLLDANLAEEKASEARMSISTADDQHLCAFQKGGIGAFTVNELNQCVEMAFVKGKELRKLL